MLEHSDLPDFASVRWDKVLQMVGISIAMFIALVGWGETYFGWSDPGGEIQLSIVTTFVLGIICGYRAKS